MQHDMDAQLTVFEAQDARISILEKENAELKAKVLLLETQAIASGESSQPALESTPRVSAEGDDDVNADNVNDSVINETPILDYILELPGQPKPLAVDYTYCNLTYFQQAVYEDGVVPEEPFDFEAANDNDDIEIEQEGLDPNEEYVDHPAHPQEGIVVSDSSDEESEPAFNYVPGSTSRSSYQASSAPESSEPVGLSQDLPVPTGFPRTNYHDIFPQDTFEHVPVDREMSIRDNWFIKGKNIEPVPVTCKKYKVGGDYTGLIKSWKVNKGRFMIKRRDGIQYFRRSLKKLSTLPKHDLVRLTRLQLINPHKDGIADIIQKVMRAEIRSKKYHYVKPVLGTRFTFKKKLDPKTNQPIVRNHYPPANCLREVSLESVPLNLLTRFHYWELDAHTGEAVLVHVPDSVPQTGSTSLWGLPKAEFRIFDPMSIINLSKDDMKKLFNSRIRYNPDNEFNTILAKRFQKIVDICFSFGVHAGGNFPPGWV